MNLLRSHNDFIKIVKQAAIDAVNASNPVAVMFGKVLSTNPLKINVEQKMTLTKEQLVLTASIGELQISDEIILLRMQGGQRFIILDKVVKIP